MTLKLLSLSYVERLCATITACYNIYFSVRKRNFNKRIFSKILENIFKI